MRRKGRVPLARSFNRKADAVAWANRVKIELEQRDLERHRLILERLTLGDLLERYLREVAALKRARSVEMAILWAFMRDKICSLPLDRLSTSDLAS